MRYVLPREEAVWLVALAEAEHRQTGATVYRYVHLRVPVDLFAKSAGGPGTVYRDGDGEYRWITVHPGGEGSKGQPVKIRPAANEPGTWHVVAGAGGKLNYLRLTGVQTPEEYATRAKDLGKKRREKAAAERARKRGRTPEERAKEDAADAALRTRQREFVGAVGTHAGWKADDTDFAPVAAKLKAEGVSADAIARLEAKHDQQLYRRAKGTVAASRRAILANRDAALGHVPLTGEAGAAGLRDVLEPPKKPAGKGFPDRDASPDDLVLALATADQARLADDLEDAERHAAHGLDEGEPDALEDVAALREAQDEARLVAESRRLTPDGLAAEKEMVTDEMGAIAARQQARVGADTPEADAAAAHDGDRLDALRDRVIDLAVLEAGPAVDGDLASEQRGAKLRRGVVAAYGEAGGAEFDRRRAALTSGHARYAEAAELYRTAGVRETSAPPVTAITDPETVLDLLARQKALREMERAHARPAGEDLDARMYGKGLFTEIGTPAPAMIAAAQRDLEDAVREKATAAFLEQIESPELLLGRGGVFTEDYDRQDLHRALDRHLSAGAYNVLNTAALALTKAPVLSREVCDVLGAGASAQLLTHVLRGRESPATLKQLAARVGAGHVVKNVAGATAKAQEAEASLDAAEAALSALTSPGDVGVAIEANERRQKLIEEARQTMGQALGEYEATAALTHALGGADPTELHTNLGPVGAETAVRQLRGLGLGREDYTLRSDGTNIFATVKASGFDALAQAPDPTLERMTDRVIAIKSGKEDDPAWRPHGLREGIGLKTEQQRVVKAFLASKRMALTVGAGGGKTPIAISALAEARHTGAVQRGLFLVPSAVQAQYGAEFDKFLAPGTLKYAATPGANRAARLQQHQDAGTGAVVMTHEGFRDDMLHLLGEDWGVDEAEARDRLMGLTRAQAATTLRGVWKKHGVDYQMLVADEAHKLLDREGKPDSVMSRLVQAAGDLTPYYASASADPIKNDVSELRSLLDKLNPDGRYGDAGAWNRRYKVNTTAAAEALKREVAPYQYAVQVPTGNVAHRRTETVPLHPQQAAQQAAVLAAVQKLRMARAAGTVDVAAAKALVGEKRFEGLTSAQAEAVARQVQKNPAAAKEQALARVIDVAPRGQNAKVQRVVLLLKDQPPTGKPAVIFAHRLGAVRELAAALRESGHRVETLTGADSARERERKRLRFQPAAGGTPEADVFVLSDAGEAGMNLQRGQQLIQYDRPFTPKTREQRNARIDRLGRTNPDLDLVDLTTDSPYEAHGQERLARKYKLRDILTDPSELLDDEGFAGMLREARREAAGTPGSVTNA